MDLKLSPDLFLGLQELQYFKDSIKDEGYKKLFQKSVSRYGVVKTPTDTLFTSLKVIAGSSNKVTIKAGIAIDKNIQFIEVLSDLTDYFTIPSDSVPRYIVIKYNTTSIEDGTVAIAANGTVTGTGTLFTERIRGGAENPTKISFPNSSTNTGEYTVLAVQSDTHLTLNVAGSLLTVESGKQYATVGCFTPGIAIDTNNKYPFVRDSYTIELRTSSTLVDGEEFILAKVINDGANLIISERRPSNKFSLIPVDDDVVSSENKIIGVENMKYQNFRHNGDTNLCTVGWGWTTSDYVLNSDSQQITINTANGGIFYGGTLPYLATFSLAGWRVIFDSGQIVKIVSSSVPAGLWVLDLEYAASYESGAISIVPNADFIELLVTSQTTPNANRVYTFAAAARYGIIELQAGTVNHIQFRHLLRNQANALSNINNGNYINESSYTKYGAIISFNQTAYMDGLITPQISPSNFFDYGLPDIIVAFEGDINNLPTHWYFCDGTNGTPDLRDKFILGARPGTRGIGTTGGEENSKLILENLPPITASGDIVGGSHSHQYSDLLYPEKLGDYAPPTGFGELLLPFSILGSSGSDTDNNKILYKVSSTELSGSLSLTFNGAAIGGTSEIFTNMPPWYSLAWIKRVAPASPVINGTISGLVDISTLGTYYSDLDASNNGVLLGNPYKLSNMNIYGGIPGIIKIRVT